MIDFIVIVIIIGVLGLSIRYIIREKKKGVKCIGCPFAESCSKRRKTDEKCDCNDRF